MPIRVSNPTSVYTMHGMEQFLSPLYKWSEGSAVLSFAKSKSFTDH
jgi:hypothetical protein